MRFSNVRTSVCFLLLAFSCSLIYSQTLQQVNQQPLRAYVLTDQSGNVVDNSGVRIGLADLEFETQQSLRKYGLPDELVQKLEPYVGLTGDRALAALKSKPLQLSQEEYNTLNKKLRQYWLSRAQQAPSFVRSDPEVSIYLLIL